MARITQSLTNHIQRFAKFFDPGGLDKCWEWKGGRTPKGYGHFFTSKYSSLKGEAIAHRVMFILENGEIPKGLFVLHKCDNPPCVNPNHLYLGTVNDNSRDMVERGRSVKGRTGKVGGYFSRGTPKPQLRGIGNGNCPFTQHQIDEMRRLRSTGMKQQEIADLIGCAQSTVGRIVRLETHKP